jgi:hypothetical protein
MTAAVLARAVAVTAWVAAHAAGERRMSRRAISRLP